VLQFNQILQTSLTRYRCTFARRSSPPLIGELRVSGQSPKSTPNEPLCLFRSYLAGYLKLIVGEADAVIGEFTACALSSPKNAKGQWSSGAQTSTKIFRRPKRGVEGEREQLDRIESKFCRS
jgi:hypothetical protein